MKISEREIEILNFISDNSDNKELSQRKISNSLGLSLGLVNMFLKKLVNKGLLKIKKTGNAQSIHYILTPKGFNERLHYNLYYLKKNIHYYSGAKQALLQKLEELSSKKINDVFIFGTDDWSEIIYLALQNFEFNIRGFIDDTGISLKFNKRVYTINELSDFDVSHSVILVNIEKKDELLKKLNGKLIKISVEYF